jgi:hypothetical protein
MGGFRTWALVAAAGAALLAIAMLATWLLLEWMTGGSRPRTEVAVLVGSALGAVFAAAGTAAATRWSAFHAGRERRAQLARQIGEIAAAAGRLDTRAHSEKVSDEEAGRLSQSLARDCQTLREAPGVVDHLMLGRFDERYFILEGLLRVRRSLVSLNRPKGREGRSRLEQYCKAFQEVGDDSLAFQISLRGVSNDLDELRSHLNALMAALRTDPNG